MVGQTLVDLVVALYHLCRATLIGTYNLFVTTAVGVVVALQYEELLAVTYALRIGHGQRGLTHREVIDCIDDIGLAGAVVADKAVEALVEQNLLLCEVLKIEY